MQFRMEVVRLKVAILAGGFGTRLAEETDVKPKPMVEVGGYPLLWHIMMHYSCYGYNEFVIALGYKGEYIKKYMLDYCKLNRRISIDMSDGQIIFHPDSTPDWKLDLIDTGISTMTGGRIKRMAPYLGNETFMCSYGDGLSNVNLHKLVEFHRSHGKLATVTAVHPTARFGHLLFDENGSADFATEQQAQSDWINGAFFVLEPRVLDYIDGDDIAWEREPMERLAAEGELMAYQHLGFWQCVDTLREKQMLDEMWRNDKALWKIWE